MSVRFDAVGDYYTRITTNMPPPSSWTIMSWAMIRVDTNAGAVFFTYEGSGAAGKSMETDTDGTTLGIFDGVTFVSGAALTVNSWYHATLTYDGSNLIGYLNGSVIASSVQTTPPNNGIIAFASTSSASERLNGRLAAIKIYDRVLNQREISEEIGQYVPVSNVGLNSWYSLRTRTGFDDSGSGRNLISNGSLAVEEGPPIIWKRKKQFQSARALTSTSHFSGYYGGGWY